jgi:hypothetical protein
MLPAATQTPQWESAGVEGGVEDGGVDFEAHGRDCAIQRLMERVRLRYGAAGEQHCPTMAEISRFFGMVAHMYFRDHLPPHFHVRYGRAAAQIRIAPAELLEGRLPPRLLALAIEWANLHRGELLRNWNRMDSDQPPRRIAPLE